MGCRVSKKSDAVRPAKRQDPPSPNDKQAPYIKSSVTLKAEPKYPQNQSQTLSQLAISRFDKNGCLAETQLTEEHGNTLSPVNQVHIRKKRNSGSVLAMIQQQIQEDSKQQIAKKSQTVKEMVENKVPSPQGSYKITLNGELLGEYPISRRKRPKYSINLKHIRNRGSAENLRLIDNF